VNGEVTVAPLRGLLTLGLPELVPLTVITTSLTQTAPADPHAFTWIVWPPVPADTDFCKLVPFTRTVAELLSSE
jgi:hypothetical protein